jgi:O-methyltransferase
MLRGIYHLLTNPRARAEWRWTVLRKVTKLLIPHYRLIWPQMAWWNDERFNDFLRRFNEYDGYNSDRRWVISQLVKLVQSIPGDTAECGVLEGSSSYLISRALPQKTHFMFDSFEGCSAPSGHDNGFFDENSLTVDVGTVKEKLKDCPNAVCLKGWIPDRFPEIADRRFAFVHIDVQQEQPTFDSLAFFYPRMQTGGIIVFDDYGFTTCPGARYAIDIFMKDKPEPIIELPTGNAFLVRASYEGRQ